MTDTLGTTTAQLLDELDRTGQLTSQAHTYINDAIKHYQDDPFKFNEQLAIANTQNGEEYMDLPPDWGEEFTLTIDYKGDGDYVPLRYRTMEQMDVLYISGSNYTGRPLDYTIFRQQIRLGPIPDASSYSVKMAYRVRPATATAEAQTNIFLQNANELVRSRAGRFMAKLILKDDAVSQRFAGIEAEALAKATGLNARYAMRGHAKRRG